MIIQAAQEHPTSTYKASSTGSFLALVLGLTFWWPFFRKYEYSALFAFYQQPVETMWSAYTPTMIGLGIALFVGTVAHKHLERFIEKRRLIAGLACITGSLGWTLTLVAPFFGIFTQFILALGCLLSSLGYAWLTLCWGFSICSLSSSHSALALLLAFATSSVLQLTAFLPHPVVVTVAVIAPTLSGIAWFCCNAQTQDRDTHERHNASPSMPLGIIGILGFFLIAGRLAVGLLAYVTEAVPDNDRLLTIVCSLVMSALILVASRHIQDKGRLLQIAWSGLVVIFMAGMFSLLVSNTMMGHVATASLSAVLGCFEVELFAIVAMSAKNCGVSGVSAFGSTVLLFRVLPNFLGKNLTPILIGTDPAWAQQVTTFVVPFMTFLAVVATIVFMNARTMGKISWFGNMDPTGIAPENIEGAFCWNTQAMETHNQASPTATCKMLASQFGLTAREVDVLLLVSEGRSYQRIADSLGISLGTVQGHVKCLYRKLGVHTKQEVIELVRNS